MKYIDADRLKAEIERRRLSNRYIDTEGYESELLEIINELQQEQAEEDLIEKAVTWWSNNLVESEPTKGHYISAFKKYMENK